MGNVELLRDLFLEGGTVADKFQELVEVGHLPSFDRQLLGPLLHPNVLQLADGLQVFQGRHLLDVLVVELLLHLHGPVGNLDLLLTRLRLVVRRDVREERVILGRLLVLLLRGALAVILLWLDLLLGEEFA